VNVRSVKKTGTATVAARQMHAVLRDAKMHYCCQATITLPGTRQALAEGAPARRQVRVGKQAQQMYQQTYGNRYVRER